MARPKKTEAEIQAMREKILDVTLGLLEEEGLEAVTSRAIAGRMGISHMSLFTYFENQSAILASLRDRVAAGLCVALDAIVERAEIEDIPPLVEEVWTLMLTHARERPAIHRLAWAMPKAGAITVDTKSVNQQVISRIAQILSRGVERGDFDVRDPRLAAVTIIGMLNMPFVLQHTGKLPEPAIRDLLVEEGFIAAMAYLKKK